MAISPTRTYFQADGNEEGLALAAKHRLKVLPAWKDTSAPWLIRAVSFNENKRETEHNIIYEEMQVGSPSLRVMWWFPSVADRNYIPGSLNPAYDVAVGFDISSAEDGTQLDAKTGEDGAPYHMWVQGLFRGGKVVCETVTLGTINDHIALDVVWEIVRNPEYVGDYFKTPSPIVEVPIVVTPPSTPPVSSEALALINELVAIHGRGSAVAGRLREVFLKI